MCPACVQTLALIAAGVGSAGGLAAVAVREACRKPEGQHPGNDAPARPADEEQVR
jgi:hypothetical protein